MIALPGVAIHCQIYESATSLVYRGIRAQDDRAIVILPESLISALLTLPVCSNELQVFPLISM